MINNWKMELEHELRKKIAEYHEIEGIDNPWLQGYLAGEINTLAKVLIGKLPPRPEDQPYKLWIEQIKKIVFMD